MCGIAGIIQQQPKENISVVKKMTDALAHRGPDGEGFWQNENSTALFGHRRLSIIDLTDAAAQPLHYLNRYTIIHNGEVYNYVELKKELVSKGYSFRTQTDTEVIVAAYDCWKENCLQYFDGMFVFAIWDEAEKTFFAARDRFGEKPFFFFYDEEQQSFWFASELKALWAAGIQKDSNLKMLFNFLTIGYVDNPNDPTETFDNNIDKLPPAHFIKIQTDKKFLVEIERYWDIDAEKQIRISDEEAIEKFTSLLQTSVQRRLRSDVSLGTSLSGGLDSSSIVALISKTGLHNLKTFSAIFPGFQKNEEAYIDKVAKQFSLQSFKTTVNEAEIPRLVDKIIFQQDEPFSTASLIPQYVVFELAKKHNVTVLLDGQGADEILAGYTRYYKWYWQELRGTKLNYELRAARALGVQEDFDWKNSLASFFPQFTASLLEGKKAKQAFKQSDLNQDFAFSNKQNFYYTLPASLNLNSALYYNTFVNGLEELLRLADRNSMAHAVEVRLPFLNGELVEFLFTLPPHFKIQHGWSKWLLRKATENCLPPEIVWRKDKVGFEPPQKLWMQNKDVQEQLMEGRKKLVAEHILDASVLKKGIIPKHTHEAESKDWRYWSAAALVH